MISYWDHYIEERKSMYGVENCAILPSIMIPSGIDLLQALVSIIQYITRHWVEVCNNEIISPQSYLDYLRYLSTSSCSDNKCVLTSYLISIKLHVPNSYCHIA